MTDLAAARKEAAMDWPEGTPQHFYVGLLRAALDALEAANKERERADWWLAGLDETYSELSCDHDEAVACFAVGDELEWPDDWCRRCHILRCVREARAASVAEPPAPTPETT